MYLTEQIVYIFLSDFAINRGAKSDKCSALRAMSDDEWTEKTMGNMYDLLSEVH